MIHVTTDILYLGYRENLTVFGLHKAGRRGSTVGSPSDSRARGPGFDTRSGRLLSFLLPLIQEGQKYVHLVLVSRLEGLSLPRNSVVRLTDNPDMTTLFTVDVKQQNKKQGLYRSRRYSLFKLYHAISYKLTNHLYVKKKIWQHGARI